MAICEDAPCCGCCGRNVYYDAWAEPEYDPYDAYEDNYFDPDQSCRECGSDDCYDEECQDDDPVEYVREDFDWAGMTE